MLMLVEYDFVMGSARARCDLANYFSEQPTLVVAAFRSGVVDPEAMFEFDPATLRERMLVTPNVPRERNLSACLQYEICCVGGALRALGEVEKGDPWIALVPSHWVAALTINFDESHVMEMQSAFSSNNKADLNERISELRSNAEKHQSHRPKRRAAPDVVKSLPPTKAHARTAFRSYG